MIFVIFKMAAAAILDLLHAIGTTYDDYLVVSIVMQNLAEIGGLVSIIWHFQYFAHFAWKRPFTRQKWFFFWGGGFHPQNGDQYQRNPQEADPCASPRRFEPSSVKIRRPVWPVREFAKKGINKQTIVVSHPSLYSRINFIIEFYPIDSVAQSLCIYWTFYVPSS